MNACLQIFTWARAPVFLVACATPLVNPLAVNVSGIDRLQSTPMESRFVVHIRVQNPNENSASYSGAIAELMLNGKRIGAGVTSQGGIVPGLGQTVVDVPITVAALGEVRQAIGLYGESTRKLDTVLVGRLTGSKFNDLGFEWRGELALMPSN